MFFKTHTLNSVLYHLKSNPDSSISGYFNLKGIEDDKVIGDCRNKLKQDGYVIFFVIPGQKLIKETLTGSGIQFIQNGGYSGEMNKVVEEIGTHNNKIVEAAISLMKASNEIPSSIVQNRVKIEYAIGELDHIANKLDNNKNIMPPVLKGYLSNIGTLINSVFKDHSLNSNFQRIELVKEDLLKICNDAIHLLEFELINLQTSLSSIHPKVVQACAQLYLDGHNREAISAAFSLVIDEMKRKFEIKGKDGKLLDGKPLMEQVFSYNNPVFVVSDDISYQEGWKMLFAGSVSALRNKYVHDTSKIKDKEYTLNLLHFASALIRITEDKTIY